MRLRAVDAAIVLVGLSVTGAVYAAVSASDNRFTLSSRYVATWVGSAYGESHPRIVRLEPTHTDSPPHDPMYLITIAGHFHKGATHAQFISFSALADKRYAWAIFAYDRPPSTLWNDDQLGQPPH